MLKEIALSPILLFILECVVCIKVVAQNLTGSIQNQANTRLMFCMTGVQVCFYRTFQV
jgi:hypothetical protein